MIRPYKEFDLEQLYDLIQKTIKASYSSHYSTAAIEFFQNHHSRENIQNRVSRGEVLVFVDNDQILATGSLVEKEISGVFVLPERQKSGLGKKLMSALEAQAEAQGISSITLHISLPSRAFYEGLHYKTTGPFTIDVGHGQYLTYWQGEKKLHGGPAVN